MRYEYKNGEKITRFSIRKYHFGAASVAVASLIFFGGGMSAKAENVPVSHDAQNSGNVANGDKNAGGDSGKQTTANNKAVTVDAPAVALPTAKVDKSELNRLTLSLDASIKGADKEKIASISNELDKVLVDAKKLLENEKATAEEVKLQIEELTKAKKKLEDTVAEADKKAAEQKKAEAKKAQEASQTGTDRSAATESSNREKPTPARRALRRRGRPQLAESENTTLNEEAGTSNKETATKELPTYTNGSGTYALAEEMRGIVKYLEDNGADKTKIALIKNNYDKLNEKLAPHEDGVLSEEDFNKALADLKQARDTKEGLLNNQPSPQPSPQPEAVLHRYERSADDRAVDPRFPRAYTTPYATAKEFYYEDGTKGSSPYDKYTYLFHTFTESLVANNRTHSPVRDVKRLVYEEVNEVEGGYLWTITFNAAHEDQQDGYAFFSIPKGQRVDDSSITIEKTPQGGVAEEVAGTGDLGSRIRGLFHGRDNIGIRGVDAGTESLEGLARGTANVGYYTRRLEDDAGEMPKSDDMFNKIADNTATVYRFQLHGRDKYTISFKTTNTNNTPMDKLYYAAGYRVQQWGRRILAEQWHGRHAYDRSDTDRFPLHVVGNGTFLINQGKHYNTAYPQGAYGFGGLNYDYKPFDADGILGYDASGAYNSNFDMHQYTAPVGSNTPSSNTKATTAGQKFEFYDKEGNKLSASQIGMHGADKPGLVEYKVKRTFADKSSDFLNIKFAIQPKTPTFTENIANSRGQTKNLTVSNGTNGYPITLFREYVENGVTKTEKVATVNANSGGNAVFNNVLIKGGKYYAQSIIPTSAYYDYSNQKHTDVRSDKSTLQEVRADGMAPTIQVGENGKPLATTPANNQVTLFVTPSADGKVSLNVQVQDDALGDGMNELSAANNGNVRYSVAGAYNNSATTFTKNGVVTGANGKKDTIKGDLKIQLNRDGGKYKIPNGGLTVTLNATDKAGNKTESATPAKTLTVKVLSAVPNEPPVRMLTGNDVQNGEIKTDVKNQVLESVKNANPDLVRAGVKFEYDTTAGNTDKIKVTYPDGQTRLLTPTKGTKPTAPVVVGPQDGTVSITPQGDTDKVTFQYVPTNEDNPKTIIAEKDGNSWGIQGTRPTGITVDSSTGKITITEPTVKDLSNVTATATFLNSDTSDTAQDTAKNPDREAPTVMMNGRALTEIASDNRFVIFRGATFNPTFKVADNSGIIANLSVKNIPNGVWFNKVNNKDVPRTLIPNGDYTFSDKVVDQNTPLGTREAIVSVSDANGNTKNYKFQYTIADVVLKNSPKTVVPNTSQGDPHDFLATTVNGTTVDNDLYFPQHMQFQWVNGDQSTQLTTVGTVQKEAKVLFPANSQNGTTTANGMTIYAPAEIRKTVTFNVKDSAKPQATINGISLGTTSTAPIFTIIRGATFNPELKVWDDSGIIQDINIQNLPNGMVGTNYAGGRQTNRNSEANAYSERLASGTVSDTQTLGEHEATIRVTGSGPTDVSTFKFKYRVINLELKNTYTTSDADKPIIGLSNNQSIEVTGGTNNISAADYWKVVDTETKEDRGKAYLPEGITYELERPKDSGGISSNPADASKGATVRMGHYTGKIKVNFTTASDINDNNSKTRTVFAPRTIEKPVYYAITPSAPTLKKAVDGTAERTTAGELLYGQAGNKPRIEVSNVVPKGDGAGNVNRASTRFVRLYSSKDPNTYLAEKEVAGNSTSVIFEPSDYEAKRPNGLAEGEELYAVTRVFHGISTLSSASASELVTGRLLDIKENSSNRIIQANDQTLNDAEKTGIRIALRKANPDLNLRDENIEITDSGAITITTADKRRGWLQTAPNKDNGAGFVTRFADIRKDYKFENIEGLKVPGRDTDKGFAWSNTTSKDNVNGDRSLIYYYDATKAQSFNFNDVLNILNLREGWSVNHTENPSFVATQGVNKLKGERRQDGFSMGHGNTFLKDGNYINVLDVVESSEGGGSTVKKSDTKRVEEGKAGGTGTTLENVTIPAAIGNGLPEFTLNNVVGGRDSIHKAQVYLRPKWVNDGSLRERNNETKDTTTNVVNLYFVPIDSTKPVVERSDSNNLGTSADNAPRLTDTSITASSLVKVTDNYDKDDETDSNANSVRNKLNVWIKKGSEEIQVVKNGRELTTATGETVLSTHIKTVDPATYELIAKTADTSENETEKQSLGFFKVGYDLNVRPVINFIQYEKLTDDDKRTLVRVNEGGQLEELPNGATVDVTFDTENLNLDYQDRRATATITFANGATTTKEIPYRVYRSFPLVNKLYDFAKVPLRDRWFYDPDYYKNEGLTGGMNWFIKREVEENGRRVFKDVPPKANSGEHVMPREINKSIDAGAGEYKYLLGATYPTGRYAATATDELSKLRREGEIVHTVFDVGANTTKVTVNSGDTLTADQAKAAVMLINGSKELPEGTTYAWVSGLTVTGRGGTEVDREVRVTLPASGPANGPFAATQTKTKTVKVKVKIKPTKPTVTPDDNGDVRIGYNTNETNVNEVKVTYTPADTNRLEDNGNVTRTPQERTTVTATKGTDNQWRITDGAKEGISVNTTTGEITLKDQVVKDQTQIQAKVAVKENPSDPSDKGVSSDENDSNKSKDGDRVIPTIGVNNTLVEVGKEFSLPLDLSDAGVGVDNTNIKVSLPNGEAGLTYDSTTKSIRGTISTIAKKDITVRVLDKNGNKAEKTISIAAVKVKPIYAIKDGTIDNVDTASNFVELPAGLTASWKDNSKPTTTVVGTTSKTVTVNLNGSNVDLTIPVKVYDRVTLKKPEHVNALGKLANGENANDYVNGIAQGVTVKWKDNKPDVSQANPNLKGYIEVSYATDDPTQPIKDILEVKLPTYSATLTHTSYETTVGTPFGNSDARRGNYFTHDYPVQGESSPVKAFWSSRNYFYAGRENAATTIGRVEDTIGVFFPDEAGNQDYQDKRRQLLPIIFDVKPQAPRLTANQFQGKAGTKPEITVNNLPKAAQLTTGLTVKVQLKDAAGTVVAEKTVAAGTESTTFAEADYRNPVTLGQQLTANVVVSGTYQKTEKTDTGTRQVPTAYSLVSDNSNSEQVTPQKPTFDPATVTSTSRTLRGTLGGFNATNKVVKVHLNDEKNTVLSSENNGGVTINNDGTWTATLPTTVKLRQSVAKNGETTTPPAITVENTVAGGTVSTRSDNKAVEMGDYSVASTVAGSKHIDITVPHDAKRVELRFHNNQETGDKVNSIVLVRGTDGWHTEATRTDSATVTNANGYVGTITSTPSTANPSENNIRIALNEQSGTAKLHIKEENANGDNTESYVSGLGLRVYNQPEAGQEPSATGKWKVVGVTNTAPTINVKGDTGKDATHRKVYDSGTTLTADLLKDLVTVTDAEDSVTPDENKPFGTGNVKIISQIPAANGTGTTPAGLYEVTLAAVDSQGKEGSQVKVYVAVKEATPAAPTVTANPTDASVTVTPAAGMDEITLTYTPTGTNKPVDVVVKKTDTGWTVPSGHEGITVSGDGIIKLTHAVAEDGTEVKAKVKKGNSDYSAEGTATDPTKVYILKGEPAREFEVEIPLPLVVSNPEDLTPDEKTELEKKVKKSNPNMDVKVDDKGNVTITDPKTGQSKVIPVKDLTVKDFTPVKPTEKVPAKDKDHLTQEEKKQVADKVKAKNPGKEVTVGDDGTATVKDPTTGIGHTIPGTDLVNQDFTPVKPTEKVPAKDKDHLTQEEKKQVADKVKAKNPGKEVTVGDDGTATVIDPDTRISHTIPAEELVVAAPPVVDVSEYTGPIGTTGVDGNGNLLAPPIVNRPALIITKWVDEKGKELKAADAKVPKVLGEANEALEAGEITGYEFVRTETKGDVVTHIFRKVTPIKPEGNANNQSTSITKDKNTAKRLANTGEAETNTGLAGLGLGILGGLLAVAKRRKKDEK